MLISELLKENEHPKHKSALPKAASINDEPEELELDGELDDEDESEDDKQAAIDAFKAAGKDLGEGLWAIAIYPGNNKGSKIDAIDGLLKAFPEFNDRVLKSTVEQLFVAVFNEEGLEFESIRATPHEDDRKTSEQFNNLNRLQRRIIGDIYSTINDWSLDADKFNTHKLKELLGR